MYSKIGKPEDCYTLEDFISFKGQNDMTYYNLSILAKSIADDGIMYSKDNIIYKYLDILKGKCKTVVLSDKEFQKFQFKPKQLAYRLYGSSELYFVLMAVNGICDIKDFNKKKIKALTPYDLNNLLKSIYSAEIDYIELNRKSVGEKNNVF